MQLLGFLKRELLYGGLSREEFQQVKEPVREQNQKLLVAWSIATGLFWAASLFLYNEPQFAQCLIVMRISLATSVFTLICALLPVERIPWLLDLCMLLLALGVLGNGIALSLLQPSERVAAMIAFALIIPVFFIDRTLTFVVLEAASIVSYAVLGMGVLTPDVYSWGVKTLAIFLCGWHHERAHNQQSAL